MKEAGEGVGRKRFLNFFFGTAVSPLKLALGIGLLALASDKDKMEKKQEGEKKDGLWALAPGKKG